MVREWWIERNGQAIARVDSLEYHGEWMGDEYITVTVKSAVPVDFHLNDYIVYRGESYYLSYDPNVVKNSRSGTYGEGFTYDGIKLYAIGGKTRYIDFKDVVLDDNHIAYTSLSEFSFFAGSVEDLADRLQANLDRSSQGFEVLTPNWLRCRQRGISQSAWEEIYNDPDIYGTWGEGMGVTLGETDINVTVLDEDDCWDMLGKAYSLFGLSFYAKGYYAIIGAPAIKPGHIFRYGKNNGLYEIERTSDDDQEVVTKVFGYGSSENLPLNYYSTILNQYKVTVQSVESDIYQDYVVDIPLSGKYFTHEIAPGADAYVVAVTSAKWGTQVSAKIWSYSSLGADKCRLDVIDYNVVTGHPLSVGDVIYFTDGINKNAFPARNIEPPANISLMSIDRLMLPGFPKQSLADWLSAVANGIISGVEAGGLTAGYAAALLARYGFSDQADDPFITSHNIAGIGLREGVVRFDNEDQKNIYPTIDGTGMNAVGWGTLGIITDNGYVDEGGMFTISMDIDGGLNWKYIFDTRTADTMKLTMTSGYCAGTEFEVTKVAEGTYEYGAHGGAIQVPCYVLTCKRKQDEQGRWLPYDMGDGYATGSILRGDTFVVTDIQMPDEYIISASVRLLIATCGWLDRRDHMRYTYVPKVDEIYMARQDEAVDSGRDAATYGTVSLHDTLKAGMQLQLEDSDLGIERFGDVSPFIDQLTIRETGGAVPTYDVVLRDEKEKGALEKLTEQISDLIVNPIVHVVERQERTLQSVWRGEWESGAAYYYETLNTDTDTLETSRVQRWGLIWECRRSFTQEPPHYGAQDWVVVGNSVLEVKIRVQQSYNLIYQDVISTDLADGESYVMGLRVYHGEEYITGDWTFDFIRDDNKAGFSAAFTGVSSGTVIPARAIFGGMVTIDGVEYDMRRGVAPMYEVAPKGSVTVTIHGDTDVEVRSARLDVVRVLPSIEYSDWEAGGVYSHTTRLISQVWNNGVLWECVVTGTAQEPLWGCTDWKPVNGRYSLGFYSAGDNPNPILGLSVRPSHIDETVEPYQFFGEENISSSSAITWSWDRESNSPALDEAWKNSAHVDPDDPTSPLKSETRTLHLTTDDMPVDWYANDGKVSFTCTVTFQDGDEESQIVNRIIIS